MLTRKIPAKLTPGELEHFERALRERRHVLMADVRALEAEEAEDSTSTSGLANHLADLGTDRAAADLRMGCRESASEEIQQIDEALERIADSSFGLCETCDAPIAKVRLEAIPYASLCLACQKSAEG